LKVTISPVCLPTTAEINLQRLKQEEEEEEEEEEKVTVSLKYTSNGR
jgi:hypothetical protein